MGVANRPTVVLSVFIKKKTCLCSNFSVLLLFYLDIFILLILQTCESVVFIDLAYLVH
jgi:hypothetical protein